jgi:hypothetical protein
VPALTSGARQPGRLPQRIETGIGRRFPTALHRYFPSDLFAGRIHSFEAGGSHVPVLRLNLFRLVLVKLRAVFLPEFFDTRRIEEGSA